jgi:hypothetical protein
LGGGAGGAAQVAWARRKRPVRESSIWFMVRLIKAVGLEGYAFQTTFRWQCTCDAGDGQAS